MGLACPISDVAEDRHRLVQAGRRGSVVLGKHVHDAQVTKSGGLTSPVCCLAGRGQSGLVQNGGLVNVTVGVQEAAHSGGDPDGVPGPPAGGRVADCGVQVGALGLHPRGGLLGGGQAGDMGWRPAGGSQSERGRAVWRCAGQR